MIASLLLLAGCTPSYTLIARDELCNSWKHQTISKHDKLTDKTASGIEGSNEARPAWGCAYGKDRTS